jgi:uncharacterized membrane protein
LKKEAAMIAIILMAILTIFVVIYTLTRKKQKGTTTARIVCFLIYMCLAAGFYGAGAFLLIRHYLNIERLGAYHSLLIGGLGTGFAWIIFIIGLFCLRQWLGVIFNRNRTIWYTDQP